MKVKYHW